MGSWQGQAKRLRKLEEQRETRTAVQDLLAEQRATRMSQERMFSRMMGMAERATSLMEDLLLRSHHAPLAHAHAEGAAGNSHEESDAL